MPTLAYPQLPLNTSPETTAFRFVDQVLRSDPTLKRVIGNHFYSWLGDPLDDADPTSTVCPWLRLTPQPGASGWETEDQHKMPMLIGIELAVVGTNVDQLTNLWGAVRDALFPQDADARQKIRAGAQAAGITRPMLMKPAYAASKDAQGNKLLVAGGLLNLLLLIET